MRPYFIYSNVEYSTRVFKDAYSTRPALAVLSAVTGDTFHGMLLTLHRRSIILMALLFPSAHVPSSVPRTVFRHFVYLGIFSAAVIYAAFNFTNVVFASHASPLFSNLGAITNTRTVGGRRGAGLVCRQEGPVSLTRKEGEKAQIS